MNFEYRNTLKRGGNTVNNAVRFGGEAANDISIELSNLRGPARRSGDFYHAKFMKQARSNTRNQAWISKLTNKIISI